MHSRRFYKAVCLVAIVEFVLLIIQSRRFEKKAVLPKFCSTFRTNSCLLDYDESANSFLHRYNDYCQEKFREGVNSGDCYSGVVPLCPCLPDSIFTNITPVYKTCNDGFLSPLACVPRHKTAIIIPFRDRSHHLRKLLKVLHQLLKQQQISYKIFVVEQKGNGLFNKAILMNAGFLELLKKQSIHHPNKTLSSPPTTSTLSSTNQPTSTLSSTNQPTSTHSSTNQPTSTHLSTNQPTIFKSALKKSTFLSNNVSAPIDCFIFHDVDMLPIPPFLNMYVCVDMPRHIGTFQKQLGLRLDYQGIFGGVTGFTKDQFAHLNGFSNTFYGWGGEDDDMLLRVKANGMSVNRFPRSVAQFEMIPHTWDQGNPGSCDKDRAFNYDKFKYGADGLRSVKYEVVGWREEMGVSWVDIRVPAPPPTYRTYNRAFYFADALRLEIEGFLFVLFVAVVALLLVLQKFVWRVFLCL